MKRHLIILSVLCLAAMTLRAQDTTEVRLDVRIRQNCDCGCHQHPVNDYDGLNSLRQRLANPSWDGKGELFRSIGTGMKVEDGKIVIHYPEEILPLAHDTMTGKMKHGKDIQENEGRLADLQKNSDEFKARKKKYAEMYTAIYPGMPA